MLYEEAKWLIEEFKAKYYGTKLGGKTLDAYYEAERILRGKDEIDRRSCTCHYKALARLVHSMYDQYQADILKQYTNGPTEDKAESTSTEPTES